MFGEPISRTSCLSVRLPACWLAHLLCSFEQRAEAVQSGFGIVWGHLGVFLEPCFEAFGAWGAQRREAIRPSRGHLWRSRSVLGGPGVVLKLLTLPAIFFEFFF